MVALKKKSSALLNGLSSVACHLASFGPMRRLSPPLLAEVTPLLLPLPVPKALLSSPPLNERTRLAPAVLAWGAACRRSVSRFLALAIDEEGSSIAPTLPDKSAEIYFCCALIDGGASAGRSGFRYALF
jgi:hypothetical protein